MEALQKYAEIRTLVYETEYLANKMASLISVLTGYMRLMGEELPKPQDDWAQKVCNEINGAGEFEDMTESKKCAICDAVGSDMQQVEALVWRAWILHMQMSTARPIGQQRRRASKTKAGRSGEHARQTKR